MELNNISWDQFHKYKQLRTPEQRTPKYHNRPNKWVDKFIEQHQEEYSNCTDDSSCHDCMLSPQQLQFMVSIKDNVRDEVSQVYLTEVKKRYLLRTLTQEFIDSEGAPFRD